MGIKILVPLAEARGGKDTFAKVAERFGYMRLAFADELKREAKTLLGRPIDKKKDRPFLIELGQRRRAEDPAYWIKVVQKRMRQAIMEGQRKFCLSDCRFPNEYEWLKELGATFIRIESWPGDRIARGMDPNLMDDESERHIREFPYHYKILNDASLAEYEDRVFNLLLRLEEGRCSVCVSN